MKINRRKSHFNVAVIGAGGIGQDHLASFKKHPAARVVALAEVSPERGREAAEKFGIPELVTDYRKLLGRGDIDVVSVALPNYLHAKVALEALKAGKHVMLDKPMTTNARDAARLVAEASKRKFWPTMKRTPCFFASATSFAASRALVAIGLSSITCLPALSASSATFAWR